MGTNQGIGHGVDVVVDNHDIPHVEVRVESARSIAEDKDLDAQLHHHADGEGDLTHRIAFVVVETALHGNDFATSDGAKKQLPLVTFHSGDREVRNVRIGNGIFNGDAAGQAA